MNKILRYSFMALMAMLFGNVFAEDIIWQEDWSSYKDALTVLPNNPNYSFTGMTYNDDGVTIKSGTKLYDATLAGGEAPELLLAKNGGSFTATIDLGGKSGDMMLAFKANKNLTITAEGATVGEVTKTGNDFIYPITGASGTIKLTFKMATNANARLDNIKLYQGTAKKPAGLSWGKASTTVTLGGDYTNIPTLQNSNNLSVKCNSSKEEVCTVTDAGVITVVGEGKTTITAAFDGDDEYEAQSVSIEITVNPAIDPDAKGQKNNPYLLTDEDFSTLVMGLKPEDVSSTASSNPKSEKLYVKGYIVNIDEVTDENLQQYGNMTFKIAAVKGDYDADMKLKVYRCNFLENKKFTSADQIKLDDDVIVYGQIQWYGGSPQVISGCNIYSLNGNTSSVNAIKTNAQFSGKMYNVAGQVVNKGYKGLVIQDGRKFVNK